MQSIISSTLRPILLTFASCFSCAQFQNFTLLLEGWILCVGRHTISRVIEAGGAVRRKHHSTLYRFLSRCTWSCDAVGKALFQRLLLRIPKTVTVSVDDTLCRRTGPHLFGAGMHHDAARSTYGRGSSAGRQVRFAFGHNWVVLSVWVPRPWDTKLGWAVPVLFRLYRPKQLCPPDQYRKRTELAAELVKLFSSWLPEERTFEIVGDAEYACRTLLASVPPTAIFTGPVHMRAELYDRPEPYPGRGRPRQRGKRLPSPRMLAESDQPWQEITVPIYGREVTLLVKSQVGLWYRVTKQKAVRVVVTRDPRGRLEDRAYFCTDEAASIEEILVRYARRWGLEVAFRDGKQVLGLEHPQNGWWRRESGTPSPKKRLGPQPRGRRGEIAVQHTFPFAFFAYATVILWYLCHGNPQQDVDQAKRLAPWYRHKKSPSFADMLAALRRELLHERLCEDAHDKGIPEKLLSLLPNWILAA